MFAEKSEAAFSNYRMWESIGFILAFGYSASLCTESKLIIVTMVTCCLLLGMCGYFIVEAMERKKNTRQAQAGTNENPAHVTVIGDAGKIPKYLPPTYNAYDNPGYAETEVTKL